MSTSTAKDLLAQADRLMRQRAPEELPVLTDLVIEEIDLVSLEGANARAAWAPAPAVVAPASVAPAAARPPAAAPRMAVGIAERPAVTSASSPSTVTAMANAREQFNAQLIGKLEELQHSVYSQVMQQLELYAAGSLKTHLRETLLPALTDIANDIANQVAEDTSTQVRAVLSKALDAEIARLRQQLTTRRL